MANTIPAAAIDDLVSNAVLYAFNDMLTPLSAFATDYAPDAGAKGQTVNIPVYPVGSAGAFGGDYTSNADSTLTAVTVTVNQHQFDTAHFTDTEMLNSSAANYEAYGRQLGAELATTVFQDVLSVVTNANYGGAAFTGAASTFDSDDVVDIKDADDTDKMPVGRSLVLSSSYYNALLKDSSIKNATNYGTDSGVQAGLIPNLYGYQVFESTAIPANSENLVGFSASPTAIAIATRYLEPQDGHNYADARPLIHEGTGVTLGVRRWHEPESGKMYITYEANYGFSVGQAAALNRMVSA